MKTLDGKVVVITGAGSGIGRALARQAAAAGAELALSDWDEVGLMETAALVQMRSDRTLRTDKLDVRDREAMASYAASVRQELGRVNAVVNNAGVALHGDFTEVGYGDFEWIMDVDFWGVVQGTKEFLPHLIDSGDGHWAPAAGEIRCVNTLFAFSTEQRARRFAIEQNILAAEGEFQGAPTRPVDIVRNASTYIASGVEAIMIDGHRTGHFLPMQNLGRYWEQLCGPLPE